MREEKKQFVSEQEAKDFADRKRASSIPFYSEVYVTGPYQVCGVWMVEYKEYYG